MPGVDIKFEVEQLGYVVVYDLNDILALFSILRLSYLIVMITHYSKWMNEKARKVGKTFATRPGYLFTMKAYLKYNSYLFISVCLLTSTVLLGLVLRTFEKGTQGGQSGNFDFIWNSFWVIILTMTTVGYGDIYPVTHLGRFVVILACVIGAVVLTLFVNAMTNTMQMKPKEAKVSREIEKYDDVQKHLDSDAQKIIAAYLRMTVLKKRRVAEKEKILKTSVCLTTTPNMLIYRSQHIQKNV